MKHKSVGILGIGSYVPEQVVTNFDLEQRLDTSDKWIVERTGIRERRVVKKGEATSVLATKAAEKALQDANVSPEDIDLIIVGTVTPDMQFPSVACLVQENIKAVRAAAFDLTAVCSGFIYGLVTGSSFIKAGTYKKVLVIGAETLSTITDWKDRNTAILFGDGAGAVVLGEVAPGYGILGVDLGAEGTGGHLLKVPAGGSRMPTTMETISQGLHFTHMDGNEVFKFAVRTMGETINKALENAQLSAGDVKYLIPHQANFRIIQSAAKRLGLPMEQVVVNVDKYGNTSAASIPIALDEGVKSGRVKAGDIIAIAGFGGGLTWGAGIIRWGK
ncbi:beta-ketoacyl-ACP synthase III [Sporomusa acidovorans]|uniref:Beta-ketoacyl-[acyl-carrier-protein] synthase III n=1 Tax=Sporomusa acidovorans (strain ATCC 49682 / DSM 3132 / Mol) TaxID=1123286 RepID=A0ABZ3IWD6_SPOA4|nr:beta-ketoacyl-ACP synthase III [Sporomusa acidovorans]OZC22640.1 3-oxoacyl-[acyl-carrier-protein] synthase 3 protein 1 [Sporomusa acidovorans DSM 3132]SDE76729.1 3-oxoacyl-[acyl-carrier-protein] synthase-3 [Sporomusa acidovorans]